MTRFDHLIAMTDEIGTFEHAFHAVPRREHGYCTDDAARVLLVVCREPKPAPEVVQLGRVAFRFLTEAQAVDGKVRNRRAATGRWSGRKGVDDCWGRSLWAFGTAAGGAPERWMRESALTYFERGAEQRSPSPRAMAFAALGAVEVLAVKRTHRAARGVLSHAVEVIGELGPNAEWPWPEARLTYANAALADALLAAGHALGRDEVVARGLTMLGWLLERETVDGHLSPTPVGGAGPGDPVPRFDQQPIEAAAMADACARAAFVTNDPSWLRGVDLAGSWFDGKNDAGASMRDARTGGGYDGLHETSTNQNQGAESTIALVATGQHLERLAQPVG